MFHKSFKLLSSHTNIPLTKKLCRLSETHKILEENIFSKLFIYFSFPLAHTILAVFICFIGADIQDSRMSDFFICCQRRRQGQGLSKSHSNIQSILRFSIYHTQTNLCTLQPQQINKKFQPSGISLFCKWKQQVS